MNKSKKSGCWGAQANSDKEIGTFRAEFAQELPNSAREQETLNREIGIGGSAETEAC
jgi:hypothetical protein